MSLRQREKVQELLRGQLTPLRDVQSAGRDRRAGESMKVALQYVASRLVEALPRAGTLRIEALIVRFDAPRAPDAPKPATPRSLRRLEACEASDPSEPPTPRGLPTSATVKRGCSWAQPSCPAFSSAGFGALTQSRMGREREERRLAASLKVPIFESFGSCDGHRHEKVPYSGVSAYAIAAIAERSRNSGLLSGFLSAAVRVLA